MERVQTDAVGRDADEDVDLVRHVARGKLAREKGDAQHARVVLCRLEVLCLDGYIKGESDIPRQTKPFVPALDLPTSFWWNTAMSLFQSWIVCAPWMYEGKK